MIFIFLFLIFLFFPLLSNAQVVVYSDAVHINEFIPDPNDGDDTIREFIELYNSSGSDIDISGWILDDIENSGSNVFPIPVGTMLSANGYLVFYRPQTKIILNNDTDHVRLIRPDLVVQDDFLYLKTSPGKSYNRIDASTYQQSSTPTPGAVNILDPTPTPDPTPSSTPLPTPSATASPTVSVYSSDIHISEFLPNPVGNDTTGEFIELYNSSPDSVDLSGWVLDDIEEAGSAPYTIPTGTLIAGNNFLVLYRPQTRLSLNNDSDHVRLVRPDGVIVDDIAYDDVAEGYSYNRLGDGTYEQSFSPSPNTANSIMSSPTPTPKPSPSPKKKPSPIPTKESNTDSAVYDFSSQLVLNEVLPNPEGSDQEGEFIEIKSLDTKTVHLAGWMLDDTAKGSPYYFPKDTAIGAKKILAFYRTVTKIALNNDTDTVRLIDPDGKVVSTLIYRKPVIEGQSWSRLEDGAFAWSEIITPGKENTIVVQEKVSPMPKLIKKIAISKSKKSRSATDVSATTPKFLGVRDAKLPWPDKVSRIVVASSAPSLPISGKGRLFILFGTTVAFVQLFAGISHKEAIWRR